MDATGVVRLPSAAPAPLAATANRDMLRQLLTALVRMGDQVNGALPVRRDGPGSSPAGPPATRESRIVARPRVTVD